ncbi:MAG: hypothetical protein CMG00_04525 [Candidatus Marinimicrobia bacterium]|nr:hypothetical protein [Candidatus Neomarinimicrobiota bacterium]
MISLYLCLQKKNPHKKNKSYFSSSQRLKMLQIMISNKKNMEIDLFELNSNEDVNYSINTVRYLKRKYQKDSLSMVLGLDLINDLDSWKDWEKIEKLVDIVCINRPKYKPSNLSKYNRISFLEDLYLDISSSYLKSIIVSKKYKKDIDINNMIHPKVVDYIYMIQGLDKC